MAPVGVPRRGHVRGQSVVKRSRIRPVSRKRAKTRVAYVKWANERRGQGCTMPLIETSRIEAGSISQLSTHSPCSGPLDIHHIARGKSGQIVPEGDYATLCRRHHNWVHANPAEATDLGLLRSQFGEHT